jgi:hypothetical protein
LAIQTVNIVAEEKKVVFLVGVMNNGDVEMGLTNYSRMLHAEYCSDLKAT